MRRRTGYENRVNNLYVFIFNPDGEVHYQGFYTDNDITYDTNAGRSKGQVSFSTTSLNNVQIVCIANLSTESVNSNYEVTQEEMKKITSLDELEAYIMTLDEQTVERSTVHDDGLRLR